MIPSRPSLPSTISRTLGPVDVLGTGRVASMPGGRGHAHPAREVGHVAVHVGLHARRAGRDPAAQRRVREAVGEVAERPALRVQLLLQRGAEHAGLDPRDDASRCRSTARGPSRRGRPRSPCASRSGGASRLPEMFVPPPNGMTTASASTAASQEGGHGLLVAPGGPPRRAGGRDRRHACGRGRAGSCRGAWTTRSRGVGGHLPLPDRPLQRRRGARRGARARRRSSCSKPTAARDGREASTAMCCWRKGPRAGLSSCVNETPSFPQPHHFIRPMSC